MFSFHITRFFNKFPFILDFYLYKHHFTYLFRHHQLSCWSYQYSIRKKWKNNRIWLINLYIKLNLQDRFCNWGTLDTQIIDWSSSAIGKCIPYEKDADMAVLRYLNFETFRSGKLNTTFLSNPPPKLAYCFCSVYLQFMFLAPPHLVCLFFHPCNTWL